VRSNPRSSLRLVGMTWAVSARDQYSIGEAERSEKVRGDCSLSSASHRISSMEVFLPRGGA